MVLERGAYMCTCVRGTHRELHEENTSPEPLIGKTRGADFSVFATSGAQRLEF